MTLSTETIPAPVIDWAAPFDELVERAAFTTAQRVITASDVEAFAELTGDHHPLHTDPAWAAAGPFGEQIAHGMLIVSIAVGLVPLDPRRILALRAIRDATFKRPVPLGGAVSVRGRITGLRAVAADAGIVSFQWSVVDDADRLACRAGVDVLWSRDA
ncbi:MAG: 3-hydroxybutyryl-CoA dehydratase [Baekduia sp.]|jgi:acyl dehydratase|nr:3-hydroxybutyryl-CoA dehydratase [Baekduia sp.]